MGIVIFFILMLVWLLPLYLLTEKKGMVAKKWLLFSLLLIAIGGFVIVVSVQLGFEYLVSLTGLAGVPLMFVNTMISAGVFEELFKFAGGALIIRLSGAKRKIDYVLLMTAAGLGFEITESLLACSDGDLISSIIRGVTCFHIFWQMFMGSRYYEACQARLGGDQGKFRLGMAKTLLIPIVLHGLNDFSIYYMMSFVNTFNEGLTTAEETSLLVSIVLFALDFAVNIVFLVLTYREALREAKTSHLTEAAAKA